MSEALPLLRCWLHGLSGRMGQEIKAALSDEPAFSFAGGSGRTLDALPADNIDVIFDFTTPAGNTALYETLQRATQHNPGLAVVIGTTALLSPQNDAWHVWAQEKQAKVLFAPNTSLGILLLVRQALLASPLLVRRGFDIEIVETHHRLKQDAPSGTAKFIAKSLADQNPDLHPVLRGDGKRQPGEIGMVASRGGLVFGEHTIRFLGDHEELSLSHRALGRGLFAQGALVMGRWLAAQKSGVYGLKDIDPAALG